MSNYVLKYARGEEVKYISHLDFVRMFHRAVRRSGLEMAFSQGFNPHPLMTVALPLSVGVTSDGEYMKIAFAKNYKEEHIISELNGALPAGFKILNAKQVEGKELDLTKIDRADYIVTAELENERVPDIQAFLENETINVMKKSKSGVKEADVRPYIYKLKLEEEDGRLIMLSMQLAAGSSYNLKPDTVLDAMEKYCEGVKVMFKSIHRVSMLCGDREYL
jgi:radical SAM-linked protein